MLPDPQSELQNPGTPADRLAWLAQQHPELGAQISAHPNAYPELQAWIAKYTQSYQQQSYPQQGYTPATPHHFNDAQLQHPSGFSNAPRARKPKKTLLIVLSSILVLLLAGAGGAWAIIATKLGGSSSPEAAATKFVTSLTSFDLLSLYGSLAPSEFHPYEESLKRLVQSNTGGSAPTPEHTLQELKGAINITIKDPEAKVETIAEGISRVTFTSGTITIDGDKSKIFSILQSYLKENFGMFDENYLITDWIEYTKEKTRLPYTFDISEIAEMARLDDGMSLISVEEKGGWYVSPLMSQADYAYLTEASPLHRQPLGNKVIAGKPSKTPEEAAENLVTTTIQETERIDPIISRLPLAERRLLSIYGKSGILTIPGTAQYPDNRPPEITEQSYSSTRNGSLARINIDALEISYTRENLGETLTNSTRIEGLCATDTREWLEDTSGSYYYEEWEKQSDTERKCLTDFPGSQDFGLDELSIIAIEEDGGWYVSPLATAADALSIITEHVLKLIEEDTLETTLRDVFNL